MRLLQTPGVRLERGTTAIRPSAMADLDELVTLRIANRDHTGPWEPLREETFYTAAGQRLELELDVQAWGNGSAFPFAVLDTSDHDRLIGRVALSNVVRGPWQNANLGYWIDRSVAGRGHASEAVRLVLDFAFGRAGLHRVQPAIMPRNQRSRRVVEKCGFRHEGVALKYLKINGVWEDHDLYAMTVDDWRDLQGT